MGIILDKIGITIPMINAWRTAIPSGDTYYCTPRSSVNNYLYIILRTGAQRIKPRIMAGNTK